MRRALGLKTLLVCVSTLGLAQSPKAEALQTPPACLAHKISYKQSADQYAWTMTWDTTKSFSAYASYFSDSAGSVLENRSEVVKNMWWTKTGQNTGNNNAWIMVLGNKKYFVRNCKLSSSSVFCQLNVNEGNGGDQINWAWSKISCEKTATGNTCKYEEAGSVKGMIVASPQKIAVNLNTQSMKDTVRLAIASEVGQGKVGAGFTPSRRAADSFWNQAQSQLGNKYFSIYSENTCD